MSVPAPGRSPKAMAGGMTTAAGSTGTTATSSPTTTAATATVGGLSGTERKAALALGVVAAIVLADTQAAPLVIALLVGGIIVTIVKSRKG